jgi:hypothetical protein
MNYAELKAACAKYGHTLPADLPKNCLYWCCHHEILCEQVGDPYERIEYIVTAKPQHERARRLAEFVPVKAQATAAELLADYKAKCAPLLADYEAKCAPLLADYKAKRDAQWADYEAKRDALWADYEAKRDALWADYKAKRDALWADYEAKCDALPLAQLHRDECPDTKWNGRTIFPEAA